MQDDLGYVAITQTIGDLIRTTIPKVLHEFGIEVSMDKRREDEAVVKGPQPNPRTLFIGADFDATRLEAPGHRGQDKSIKRFDEVVETWSKYPPGSLVPLETVRTISRDVPMARTLPVESTTMREQWPALP